MHLPGERVLLQLQGQHNRVCMSDHPAASWQIDPVRPAMRVLGSRSSDGAYLCLHLLFCCVSGRLRPWV